MTRRTPARVWLAAVVVTVAMAAAACGSGSSSSSSSATQPAGGSTDVTQAASGPPKMGGTLNYALDAESDGWDPTKNRWATAGTEVGMAIFDPLAAYDADAKAQPYLAQSFTPNADFTEWTVALRPNVTFQDGTPLDATVLKTTFEAHKSSALTAPSIADLDSVTVTGALTAVFKMKEPWAAFPASLTGQLGVVPSPGMLAAPDGSQHPVGTGPFAFQSWIPDNQLVTTRYANYWRTDSDGTQLPYLDGVTFKVIPEPDSAVDSALSGQIDEGYTTIPSAVVKVDSAVKDGKLQVVEAKGQTESAFVMLNGASAPFDSLTARQAVAYATDSAAYRATVDQGVTQENHTVFRVGTTYYTDSPYPQFDLDKAKALVDQYTQETGQPLAFTFLAPSTNAGSLQAQFLKAQWEAAGMKVDIKQEEQASQIVDAVTGQYQATGWGQFGSPDPDYDYVWWISDNAAPVGQLGLNIARNKDPVIDQALRTARASNDPAVRKQAYATFSDQLNQDLPYIWLARGRYLLYAANDVRGLTQGPLPDGEASYPLGGPGGFALVVRLTQTWFDR